MTAVTEIRKCLEAKPDGGGPQSAEASAALAELDRVESSLPVLEALIVSFYR